MRFAFISSNSVWGGSEELWSLAALELKRNGHAVTVFKPRLDPQFDRIKELAVGGTNVYDLRGPHWTPRKLRTLCSMIWPVSNFISERVLTRGLSKFKPHLAVISQGLNYEGWMHAHTCQKLNVPYVMISQKADDLYWPTDDILIGLRAAYQGARAALFVSHHNLLLTEQQLGLPLANSRVIRNPFHANWGQALPWPSETAGLKLACIARLDIKEKGQDLIIRVLALPKWRKRRVSVSFFGQGHNLNGLESMARMLDLKSVSFQGYTTSPARIWDDHHALVLASRCEGLPLVLVEAMLSGRPAIVTDVGGNAEMLIDEETGFLAAAPTVQSLDEALERAWSKVGDWSSMGRHAAEVARERIPESPAVDLAQDLVRLASNALTYQQNSDIDHNQP